ncbi:hypothetical protein [Sphingorhabdus sp. SMR4y]|uniref:hypothetical protein n=1 Tax=Sphingorhabdus sp. SMR4y TaxID=2584094 RepID=UPI000B5C7DE0|nr:hypothetical protein [Sphingorhabdus sp. SMR4y]ASK87274.1 hypothetical protein SPHFLASMR4Y_00488 [Sphingorhabdus sp. SMR4y]
MDWGRDHLFDKAKLYSQRAGEQDFNSAMYGFWMSLSLELLARAALAKIHPVLLADPTNEGNIHYVFGINPKGNPRSVAAKAVFARCSVLIDKFTDKMSGHCLLMADRRNKELHSGAAAFENIPSDNWLPATFEVFEVLLEHLGSSLDDFLGNEHAGVAKGMLQDRRDHIEKEVKDRVSVASKAFASQDGKAKAQRIETAAAALKNWENESPLGQIVDCPACGLPAAITGESVNRGPLKVSEDDGTLTREVRVLPNKFACPTCGLKMDGYQELLQVNLGKVFTSEEDEDPIEFFGIIPEDHVDIDKLLEDRYYDEMNGYQNE